MAFHWSFFLSWNYVSVDPGSCRLNPVVRFLFWICLHACLLGLKEEENKINLEKESKAYILPIVWIFSIMVKPKYLVKSCMKFFVKSTLIWTVRSNSMNTCRFVKSQHLFSSYLFKHKHTQTDTRFQILRHSIYPIDFDCFASMINAVIIRNLYFFR